MADMTFNMLLRLMDQWSGPADKVRASMRNLSTSAQNLRRTMGKKIKAGFSEDEIAHALARSENRISAAQNRLVGAAARATVLAAPVMAAGNSQEALIDFANLAEISAERTAQLAGELNGLRKETGKSNGQLLAGLSEYVGKGMSLDAALASLRATGRAAKATTSEIGTMAASGFAVMDNLMVAPDQLGKAFDVMAKSGKEGSFELGAMARNFPEITAQAKALKMEGMDAVASLAAALQIAMKSAGSEDQAANNMANFLGKITAPDTVKKFKKLGVDIEREMKTAADRGADPLEHMLMVIDDLTGGDAFKMGELFADKQVLDFLRAMIPNMKEYQRIRAAAAGADGVIDADYARVMQGFNQQWGELRNSVTALVGASGALLPIFTDIMRTATSTVETVAAWTAANPELTATIVKGTAAFLAFGVATRVVGYGMALAQGGLLRTASLFLKFDKAGKNVSALGRSARFAGRNMGRLTRIMRTPLKWSIAPIKWTAALIPKIPWVTLTGGKLALSALITPLKWTSKILPNFAPALARFAGFRQDASKEITKLSKHVDLKSKAMQRSLSRLKWGAFGAGLGMISAMRDIPEDPKVFGSFQEDRKKSFENAMRQTPIIKHVMQLGDWQLDQKEAFQKWRDQPRDPAPAVRGSIRDGTAPMPGETTYQSTKNLDIKVQVDMPVTINKEMKMDSAAIAREAGKAVGADVERKIRGSLNDAENAE